MNVVVAGEYIFVVKTLNIFFNPLNNKNIINANINRAKSELELFFLNLIISSKELLNKQ